MKLPRRRAREQALQVLYQLDLNEGLGAERALAHFGSHFAQDGALDDFARRLVVGVCEHLSELDLAIEEASENWRADRMPIVDRNLLRLGAFELLFCDDIPATVSINEVIEIAKFFGSESSPAFVNGILDRIRQTLSRPEKAP